MAQPKTLTTDTPVRLIFAGGFLGSGKTTALSVLAKHLLALKLRVGIITNDQSGNLADTIIVRQMLADLNVPVEEVVEGCFCCRFDELVDQMEKILAHNPAVLMGEPVGSCTDFVAAVAHPIKIYYKDTFIFAPFSTIVDPERVRELLLKETPTTFPEEVAYLFSKQLEEADLVVLNKIDLLDGAETQRLMTALREKYPSKHVMAVSAREGTHMQAWLDVLLSERPGAGTVLREIDYDRYAAAEAVLGWLNAAVQLSAATPVAGEDLLTALLEDLRRGFTARNAGIGHLKCALTAGGKSMWANVTGLLDPPVLSDQRIAAFNAAALLINARVQLAPDQLEAIVRDAMERVLAEFAVDGQIRELQCFSPAYPAPPYLMR
jgi:Ni2+-binding GTPase involved in maturation of urease and hydrogenase